MCVYERKREAAREGAERICLSNCQRLLLPPCVPYHRLSSSRSGTRNSRVKAHVSRKRHSIVVRFRRLCGAEAQNLVVKRYLRRIDVSKDDKSCLATNNVHVSYDYCPSSAPASVLRDTDLMLITHILDFNILAHLVVRPIAHFGI